jgi:hypothetical protein
MKFVIHNGFTKMMRFNGVVAQMGEVLDIINSGIREMLQHFPNT